MAKFRKRKNREFCVYAEGSCADVIQRTSFERGERLVDGGVYSRVYDEHTGEHRAYQIASSRLESGPGSSLLQASQATIKAGEIQKFAGLRGRSHTAGMPEHKRLEREKRVNIHTGKYLLAEDDLERIAAKVCVWKTVGAKKRGILRAWPQGMSLKALEQETARQQKAVER